MPAQQAFLKQLQEQGSEVQLSDPTDKLAAGHAVCQALVNIKAGSARQYTIDGLKHDPRVGYLMTTAALDQLCPELKS